MSKVRVVIIVIFIVSLIGGFLVSISWIGMQALASLNNPSTVSKQVEKTPTPEPTPTLTPTPVSVPERVQANGVYLYDVTTDQVLADVSGNNAVPIASTTKIMAALVALEMGSLDQSITVPQASVDRIKEGASDCVLVVGDILTLEQLLYCILLRSGADGAVAVAEALGGQEYFVQQMNNRAASLGLTNTHFINVDGLTFNGQQDHYSSASDVVYIALAAMNNPTFAHIVSQTNYSISPTLTHHAYNWENNNPLLYSYPGTIGIKTGYTTEAKWCFVFAAVRNGRYIIGAILGSPSNVQRDFDAQMLLDWGFAQ